MTRSSSRGFTLVELLVVICILTLLAGLISPVVTKAQLRARTLACSNNLRQIGVAATLYAGEHNQELPKIEPWPAEPIYTAEDGAVSIVDALNPYGIAQSNLKCTTDILGPNYFKKEGSSYCWCPMANGQKVTDAKVAWMGAGEVTLDKLFMAYDYSAVHSGLSNVLFADGHVSVPSN